MRRAEGRQREDDGLVTQDFSHLHLVYAGIAFLVDAAKGEFRETGIRLKQTTMSEHWQNNQGNGGPYHAANAEPEIMEKIVNSKLLKR